MVLDNRGKQARHAVTESSIIETRSRRDGLYDALCGLRFIPASMIAAPGRMHVEAAERSSAHVKTSTSAETAPIRDTTSPATVVVEAPVAPRAPERNRHATASDEPPQPDEPRFMLLRLRRGLVGETQRVTHVVVLEGNNLEPPDIVHACCGLTFGRADADEIPLTMTTQPCFGCLLARPIPIPESRPTMNSTASPIAGPPPSPSSRRTSRRGARRSIRPPQWWRSQAGASATPTNSRSTEADTASSGREPHGTPAKAAQLFGQSAPDPPTASHAHAAVPGLRRPRRPYRRWRPVAAERPPRRLAGMAERHGRDRTSDLPTLRTPLRTGMPGPAPRRSRDSCQPVFDYGHSWVSLRRPLVSDARGRHNFAAE